MNPQDRRRMVELFADAAYHEVLMRLAETPEERSKHKYMYEHGKFKQ